MTLENRLLEIRKALHINQTDFASSMGFGRSVIADIERGQTKVTTKILDAVMRKHSANVSWLLTGEGEMFLPSGGTDSERPSLDSLLVTQDALEASPLAPLLKEGGKLPVSSIEGLPPGIEGGPELARKLEKTQRELEHTQERVEALREIVYREHGIKEEPEEIREVLIPYLGFGGAAGPLRELDTIEDQIAVREDFLPPNREKVFAVRIEGGSMADIIPDGSNVLLRVCQEPISGRVYVFTLKGKATIKKFRLDHTGPHFEYMDGSGRSIYPSKGEQWYCNAEFLRVLG